MKMQTGVLIAIITLVSIALVVPSTAEAKNNKSKGKGAQVSQGSSSKSTPPGWSKGKKTGWRGGSYPPGWSKWDKKKQAKWVSDRDEAMTEIDTVCIRYKIGEQKRNQITEAFGEAIGGGLVIHDASKKLIDALKDENERKALMIDTTKSVLDLLK